MKSHIVVKASLVILLLCADVTYCKSYYIIPTQGSPCPQDFPCFTLSQFATAFSRKETNISLFFQPGNHTLDRELSLAQVNNITMTKDGPNNETVVVECLNTCGKFHISETNYTSINDLHFIGCGSNNVSHVKWLTITGCTFQGVQDGYSVLMLSQVHTATIIKSSFLSNSLFFPSIKDQFFNEDEIQDYVYSNPNTSNGALLVVLSNVSIISSIFMHNRADIGGAIVANNGHLYLTECTHRNNTANFGGVMATSGCSVDIENTTFINNVALQNGGVFTTNNDIFSISSTTFTNNSAEIHGGGGVIFSYTSHVEISNSKFTNNSADDGGVIQTYYYPSFLIISSSFTNNSAVDGGVIYMFHYSASFNITDSIFANNIATENGGVVFTLGHSSLFVNNSIFVSNKATLAGATVWCFRGSNNYAIYNSNFTMNAAFNKGGGVIRLNQCFININSSTFNLNNGSVYAFGSTLNFSGFLNFANFTEPMTATTEIQEGAITCFQSTVTFTADSTAYISKNQASQGSALLATESTIWIYGEVVMVDNVAKSNGGGIFLKQSNLKIIGKCQIVNNVAVMGGGIHSSSSTIAVYQPGGLNITNNSAERGGGMYLEVNSKLYIMKTTPIYHPVLYVGVTGNHAVYGGALYVADDSNSGACSPDNECFMQTLTLSPVITYQINTENMNFSENTASKLGSELFGGLLDRCIPSPFAELYNKQKFNGYGISYLRDISNIELESISSQPIRVCFCNSEQEPDCSYQPPTIRVQKGKAFNVSLVAVDQANHTVNANITASVYPSDGGFGNGQQIQGVRSHCTNLTFSVFSSHSFVTVYLYPDGPCGSARLSTSNVSIQFKKCTCPVGFKPISTSNSSTKCECVCDSALSPYITKCNINSSSVLRKGINSWIYYTNDTPTPGYVIYPNCPFDYCQPQTESIYINFNLLNGANLQCAHNRTGILCGGCEDELSLSFASSRCISCRVHWPGVFAAVLLASAIAGILLVSVLLALNMTVSVGLINGFIFYANTISAGSGIFFPSTTPNFPSIFIAWLNLDIGIDDCFFDGLDAYTKTWLQLAFPLYLIILVVTVIIIADCSPRFCRLLGKRNPVATLATLILLSYAKLLSVTITALSFAVLHFPDGHKETVWLPDGNVPYFQGKHIPLVLLAFLIILITLPYTAVLFLWQWIVGYSEWKIFSWTRNTKLSNFITSHHAPHNDEYRYWTGLLLLVRAVLYITASITVSASPQTLPLIIIVLLGGIFLFKNISGKRVYKEPLVDIVETMLLVNILALSAFSIYEFKANIVKQIAVAYTFTVITFILFIGAICYHVKLLIGKKKPLSSEHEINPLISPVEPPTAEVTRTYIRLPQPDKHAQPEDSNDSYDINPEDLVIQTMPQDYQ